jgi:hypothetical protein
MEIVMDRMTASVTRLVSDRHGPYLGIHVDVSQVSPFLEQMRLHLSEGGFEAYSANQKARDGGLYHITLVNPFEYRDFTEEQHQLVLRRGLAYRLLGLGHARSKEEEAYFVVVDSPDMARMRSMVGLASTDFHVTLGFKSHDLHDADKGIGALIGSAATNGIV